MKTAREPKIYGSICQPGGRKLEITSEHSEWLDWATKTLYEAAEKERKPWTGSIQCPHCHWGFQASVIEQHIREKH